MEPNINKILVPVDFSDYSKSSLRYAVNFAKHFKAEICLVYVVEPMVYPPDFSMGQIAIPSIDIEMDKRAADELKNLAKKEIPREVYPKLLLKPENLLLKLLKLQLQKMST